MLKPKYKTTEELVADFNSNIRYLDRYDRKDTTLLPVEQKQSGKPITESVKVVEARPAAKAEVVKLSKYSTSKTAIDSFRVLAGLEERVLEPWNCGIVAETRSVSMLEEDFEMVDDVNMRKRAEGGLGGLGSDSPHYKQDLSDRYSAKAAHHAVGRSARTLSNSHAVHSYWHDLPSQARSEMAQTLSQHHAAAAGALRTAAGGAPDKIHHEMHTLADRHERHSKIYAKGGRPKLEAIEEMQAVVESIDPLEYFDVSVH